MQSATGGERPRPRQLQRVNSIIPIQLTTQEAARAHKILVRFGRNASTRAVITRGKSSSLAHTAAPAVSVGSAIQ